MKIALLIILLNLYSFDNLDPDLDFNVKDKEKEESEESGSNPHLIPDINCLVSNFPELFGFPEKEVNA